MTDERAGRHVPSVKYADVHRARELLKRAEAVPEPLRPAVAEIVRSAAKRRWVGVVWLVLGTAYLVTSWLSHQGVSVGVVLGTSWLVIGAVQLWEPQRTIQLARRQGLGPVTRHGWPR